MSSDMNIYLLEHIETPRLMIRPVQYGDEILLNKAIHNSLELLQKWQPWAEDPSIAATRDFIWQGVFAWKSGTVVDFPMIIFHKEDQKIIGASGYNDRSNVKQGLYEIGYWCDIDYQGKGFVTECANALTRYALEALKASKVVLSIKKNNIKSIAVAKRLHFVKESSEKCVSVGSLTEKTKQHDLYFVKNTDHLPKLLVAWSHRG